MIIPTRRINWQSLIGEMNQTADAQDVAMKETYRADNHVRMFHSIRFFAAPVVAQTPGLLQKNC